MRRSGDQEIASKFACMRKCTVRWVADDCVAYNFTCLFGRAQELIPQRSETWDLVFIDANKQEYVEYYEAVIDHVRPGGLILSDNVLWSGKVVFERNDVDARVIHRYNEMLFRGPRVEVLMLPIRDGLSIARRV